MATRGRKKGALAAKSSQERKAEFDKRMRNDDLGDPSAPVRSPSVFYISAAAKAVISRNREILKLNKVRPATDSEFLEQLLLRHEAGGAGEPEGSSSDGDTGLVGPSATQLRQTVDSLLARNNQLLKERDQLRRSVNSLTDELAEEKARQDTEAGFDEVILVHSRQPVTRLLSMVERLEVHFKASSDDRELARQVHGEIQFYLYLLKTR